jgi:hypothetical protein
MQEGKKKFEKQTAKFCLSQERYLNLSTKKHDAVLKEVSTGMVPFQTFRHFVTGCPVRIHMLGSVDSSPLKYEYIRK